MLLVYRCPYFNLLIFLFVYLALRTLELENLMKTVQDITPDVFTSHIRAV